MSNPLDKHIQNAFADFEGLRISGSIPLRDEVVNELIAQILQNGVPVAPSAAAPPSPMLLEPTLLEPTLLEPPPAPRGRPDANALLKRVKRAQVRFEEGRAVLDFEIGV